MEIKSDFEFLMKVVIIGDSTVGKTNFIFKFAEGKFSPVHIATTGFDYKSRIIKLPNSKKTVKLQVWDTAGQERYMCINKSLFHKVQGIVLMYDLTERDTFEHVSNWLEIVKGSAPNKPVILVANKLDIADESRIVTYEEGEAIAKNNNVPFYEASGKNGKNVNGVFLNLSEIIYANMQNNTFGGGDNINLNDIKPKDKRNCCR